MKTLRMTLMACISLAAAACSYNGIRMSERHRCSAMPQSQSESCYSKTRMTKSEYDTERRKLADSKSSGEEEERLVDPRYKEWIP